MSQEKVVKMSKFICVFCDERKRDSDARITNGDVGICRSCYETLCKTAPALPYDGVRSISYIMSPFEYKGRLRDAIIDFKFGNCWSYAPLFADMMQDYIDSYGIMAEQFDFIVPVPLHEKRLKERGFNQSESIAEHVARNNGIPMRTDLLIRTRATKKQSTLRGTERALNVKDAFKCTGDVKGKKILLFDDICTTGGTLRFCADALKEGGAEEICALTLAIHGGEKLKDIMY